MLDKKIILPLEIKDDEANEGLIDYSFSVDSENSNPRQSAQSSSHVGESISIKLFRISPVWPNFVKCVLLNLLWLQFKFLPITLLVVVGYLLFSSIWSKNCVQFVFVVDMADFFIEFPGTELTLDVENHSTQLLPLWDLDRLCIWISLSLCLSCTIWSHLVVLRPLTRKNCTED